MLSYSNYSSSYTFTHLKDGKLCVVSQEAGDRLLRTVEQVVWIGGWSRKSGGVWVESQGEVGGGGERLM